MDRYRRPLHQLDRPNDGAYWKLVVFGLLIGIGLLLAVLFSMFSQQKGTFSEKFSRFFSDIGSVFVSKKSTPAWDESWDDINSLEARKERIRLLVNLAGTETGVDPNLIWAVITVESNFDVRARSHRGAMGLMQLMPLTAKAMEVKDPWSAQDNIMGGSRYLAKLIKRFEGNLELAVAAYNAGPSAVRRHNGIPPYRETQRYVKRVLKLYRKAKYPHGIPLNEKSRKTKKKAVKPLSQI